MKTLLVVLTASICLYTAQSALIEYRWTATGNGAAFHWQDSPVATNFFTDALFTISAIADTDQISVFENGGGIVDVAATVFVTGVGSAKVAGTDTMARVAGDRIDFIQEEWGGDSWFGIVHSAFETYNLHTAIGPISGPPNVHSDEGSVPKVWRSNYVLGLSHGKLILDGDSISTVTFEAELIPEPSSLALVGLGSLALLKMRRRAP